MIREFCDRCTEEITPKNRCTNKLGNGPASGSRLGGTDGRMTFEITTGWDGTWNGGHLCKYCVIDAVKSLDDRPREAVPVPVTKSRSRRA